MNPTKLEQRETRRPKGVVTLWPQEVTIGNEKQPSILQVYNLAKKQIISKLLLSLKVLNWPTHFVCNLRPTTSLASLACLL